MLLINDGRGICKIIPIQHNKVKKLTVTNKSNTLGK